MTNEHSCFPLTSFKKEVTRPQRGGTCGGAAQKGQVPPALSKQCSRLEAQTKEGAPEGEFRFQPSWPLVARRIRKGEPSMHSGCRPSPAPWPRTTHTSCHQNKKRRPREPPAKWRPRDHAG